MIKAFGLALLLGLFGFGCGIEPGQEPQPTPQTTASQPAAADSAERTNPTEPGETPELSHTGWCLLVYQECAGGADKCKQCLCKNSLELCMTPPGHLYDCAPYCDGTL